jgi:hypothetical protein
MISLLMVIGTAGLVLAFGRATIAWMALIGLFRIADSIGTLKLPSLWPLIHHSVVNLTAFRLARP